MKKIIFTLIVILSAFKFSTAQVLPSFELGVKGGINLATLNHSTPTFSSGNRAGYLGGIWARFGALGFNFQPELYLTSKNVEINDGGTQVKARFTSLDLPLLLGGKVGAFGFGGRFYTGPLISFAINKDQNLGNALGEATSLNYKEQNLAWVFGAGVDIRNISVDLRYEAGLSKQQYGNSHTRVSLFNLSLAVPLVKL